MVIKQLIEDLNRLSVKQGDVILVHTSIKGLKTEGLSPQDIFDTLMECIKEQGTLLVPSLSYATVTEAAPVFDVKNTPACIGTFPEFARTQAGGIRSIHPTHSVVAFGKYAKELTAEHEKDNTPVGAHSPFRLLPQYGGKILMFGCSLLPNTFMHGVEEAAQASYPLAQKTTEYTLIFPDKSERKKEYFPHHFGSLVQRYDRIADILTQKELKNGKTLGGSSYLIDSAALMQRGVEQIHTTDKYFVDEK